jgi:uracil-DNA glycosylase
MSTDKTQQLVNLYQEVEKKAGSLPLMERPADFVPGEGNPEAEIMFIGEAPGEQEAKLRRPFVGRSGQLFRKTLVSQGIPEESVYISNIVKARPPENRDPFPEEIAAYKPYLDQEIKILQPAVIVTLGRFSMNKFLPDVKISQVHGRLHKIKWGGQRLYILPMYHPAAALRATQVKTSFEADFQKIPKIVAWIKNQSEDDQLQDTITEALF